MQSVTLDWLCYAPSVSSVNLHRLAELRSLAYHREVARRFRAEPSLADRAREKVLGLLATGGIHKEYAAEWVEILSLPAEEACARFLADDDRGVALRQTTPFTGLMPAKDRWALWKHVRRELEEGAA